MPTLSPASVRFAVLHRPLSQFRREHAMPSILTASDGTIVLPHHLWRYLINSPVSATHLLLVNNTTTFIHAPIVRLKSRHLAEMLKGGIDDVISLDVPFPDTFPTVLRYLYTGDIDIRISATLRTLATARRLRVDCLYVRCVDLLCGNACDVDAWDGIEEVELDVGVATDLMDACKKDARARVFVVVGLSAQRNREVMQAVRHRAAEWVESVTEEVKEALAEHWYWKRILRVVVGRGPSRMAGTFALEDDQAREEAREEVARRRRVSERTADR
ncbi:hypothetical protein HK101_003004 [Irineochytrium annulatum]|nr:hypothetical protein HK101_003004 [Irineochytrium annulatum]